MYCCCYFKGDLCFHQNVVQLPLFGKNIFPFLYAELFSYDNSPNEGAIKFLAKFGAISQSPQK